jgi:predicted  nucleic acid-binding Zn-ribbon protein
MKKYLPLVLLVAVIPAKGQWVVSDPVVEQATMAKNAFDQLKYAWEQTQWAQQLSSLAQTLDTVKSQLEVAQQVKTAIGNPAAISGAIQSGLFSSYLRNSGITDTLSDLSNITQQGAKQSVAIQQMYRPIDLNAYKQIETPFEGTASFRDETDPLKQFRSVENAYSNFQDMLQQAQSKRKELNTQIAALNDQLKNAQDDAEVQKLQGSLTTAQTSLKDLDGIMDGAEHQVKLLHMLNENRAATEAIAAEEISRARNRESAKMGSDAEASAAKSGSQSGGNSWPPGF